MHSEAAEAAACKLIEDSNYLDQSFAGEPDNMVNEDEWSNLMQSPLNIITVHNWLGTKALYKSWLTNFSPIFKILFSNRKCFQWWNQTRTTSRRIFQLFQLVKLRFACVLLFCIQSVNFNLYKDPVFTSIFHSLFTCMPMLVYEVLEINLH